MWLLSFDDESLNLKNFAFKGKVDQEHCHNEIKNLGGLGDKTKLNRFASFSKDPSQKAN